MVVVVVVVVVDCVEAIAFLWSGFWPLERASSLPVERVELVVRKPKTTTSVVSVCCYYSSRVEVFKLMPNKRQS